MWQYSAISTPYWSVYYAEVDGVRYRKVIERGLNAAPVRFSQLDDGIYKGVRAEDLPKELQQPQEPL